MSFYRVCPPNGSSNRFRYSTWFDSLRFIFFLYRFLGLIACISGFVRRYIRSMYIPVSFVTKYKTVKVLNSDHSWKIDFSFLFFFFLFFFSIFVYILALKQFWYNEPKSVGGVITVTQLLCAFQNVFFYLNIFFLYLFVFAYCAVGQASYSGQFTMSCKFVNELHPIYYSRSKRNMEKRAYKRVHARSKSIQG